jgi:hypothetical protein
MKSNMIRDIISCVAFISLCSLFACQEIGKSASEGSKQPIGFASTAEELYTAYSENEVAADMQYKGKIGLVHGVVQDIGKDFLDNAYIVIGGEGLLNGVQCLFQKSEEARMAALSKGQTVTVKGKVDGKFGNVVLRRCTIQ